MQRPEFDNLMNGDMAKYASLDKNQPETEGLIR